jgi:hypothetical protein
MSIAVVGFSFTRWEAESVSRRRGTESENRRKVRPSLLRCSRIRVNQAKQKAEDMDRNRIDQNKPVFDHQYPNIYATAVGLIAWFVLAAWVFFDHRFGQQSEVSLQLTMMSVLLFAAVLLPWSLSLVWQLHRMSREGPSPRTSFRDWWGGDFEVWGSKVHGAHAAIDMVLPLAAVAFGLTAIGIVFLIEASLAS